MQEIRCPNIVNGRRCNRKLGEIEGKAEIKCPKCGMLVKAVAVDLRDDYDVVLIDKNT
jgi:phage FluMu protein Com